MRKLLTRISVSTTVYFGCVTIAAACGCSSSTEFSMTMDPAETTMTAVATYYSYPQCDSSIEAVITAPDGTTAYASDSNLGSYGQQLTATAQYTIGTQDGTYSGVGHYYWNDNSTNTSGQFPDQTQVTNAPPFVQFQSTAVTGSPMDRLNGSATFTVGVLTSLNCPVGDVKVTATIGHPNTMDIQIQNSPPPDGNGALAGDTGIGVHSMGLGQSHQFTYAIKTGMNNQVGPASGQVTANWNAYPCNPIPPASGVMTQQPFNVN